MRKCRQSGRFSVLDGGSLVFRQGRDERVSQKRRRYREPQGCSLADLVERFFEDRLCAFL
jgi:hypothetical protein